MSTKTYHHIRPNLGKPPTLSRRKRAQKVVLGIVEHLVPIRLRDSRIGLAARGFGQSDLPCVDEAVRLPAGLERPELQAGTDVLDRLDGCFEDADVDFLEYFVAFED